MLQIFLLDADFGSWTSTSAIMFSLDSGYTGNLETKGCLDLCNFHELRDSLQDNAQLFFIVNLEGQNCYFPDPEFWFDNFSEIIYFPLMDLDIILLVYAVPNFGNFVLDYFPPSQSNLVRFKCFSVGFSFVCFLFPSFVLLSKTQMVLVLLSLSPSRHRSHLNMKLALRFLFFSYSLFSCVVGFQNLSLFRISSKTLLVSSYTLESIARLKSD